MLRQLTDDRYVVVAVVDVTAVTITSKRHFPDAAGEKDKLERSDECSVHHTRSAGSTVYTPQPSVPPLQVTELHVAHVLHAPGRIIPIVSSLREFSLL